jgi:hypothetical protein
VTTKERECDVDRGPFAQSWFEPDGSSQKLGLETYVSNIRGLEFVSDTSPRPYISTNGLALIRKTLKSECPNVSASAHAFGSTQRYEGRIFSSFYEYNPVLPTQIIQTATQAAGVKGHARFKPTRRNGSLGQAIVELRDVKGLYEHAAKVLEYKHRTLNIAHQASGDFLNAAFGWVPLLSDICDVIHNATGAKKRWEQLVRDNDKAIRRSGTIDQVQSSSTVSDGPSYYSLPSMNTNLYAGQETRMITTTHAVRHWFAARFRYYLDHLDTSGFEKYFPASQRNRILYGTDVSPALVYKTLPWTWLSDWFITAGDAFSNAYEDQADRLVAEYECVMGHTIDTVQATVKGSYKAAGNTVIPYTASQTLITEQKDRCLGNPYGVYFNPPDLTSSQVAILAALNINKSTRRWSRSR